MQSLERRITFGGPCLKELDSPDIETHASFGGVIFLTEDPELFLHQLKLEPSVRVAKVGADFLLDDVSTDQIIRVGDLLTDDIDLLGERVLCGLPADYGMETGRMKRTEGKVLVVGERFGSGSSREQAVWALLRAGFSGVLAKSLGPIFERNAAFLGLLTSNRLELAEQIQQGESVPLEAFLEGKDPLLQRIMLCGGLFGYLGAVKEGGEPRPTIEGERNPRAMNIWEQRLARAFGVKAVRGGDVGMLPVDLSVSYVGLSGLAFQAIISNYKEPRLGVDPERLFLFEDHFAHSTKQEIPELTTRQRQAAQKFGIPQENYFYGTTAEGGGKGIIHRVMLEKIDPRTHQVVLVTDSHTPTLAALPILPIPVGSTLFGAGIAEGMIPYSVSPVLRVELTGSLPPGLSIRDIQLELAGTLGVDPKVRVVEFGGEGFKNLSMDGVVALCNMVPEVFGAETAVTESFEAGLRYLEEHWGIGREEAEHLYSTPGVEAEYAQEITVDLSQATPWIAKPGSPHNALSLKDLDSHPPIDKAFLVSCTLGLEDLAQAAAVVQGRRLKSRLIVVPSSKTIAKQAERGGIVTILQEAGAEVVGESACGPCIGEGLGSLENGEIAITASNRNYPRRMGEGNVYMASPALTALAATLGQIPTIEEFTQEIDGMVKSYKRIQAKLTR